MSNKQLEEDINLINSALAHVRNAKACIKRVHNVDRYLNTKALDDAQISLENSLELKRVLKGLKSDSGGHYHTEDGWVDEDDLITGDNE